MLLLIGNTTVSLVSLLVVCHISLSQVSLSGGDIRVPVRDRVIIGSD